MKALCKAIAWCVFVIVAQGQKEKKKYHHPFSPPHFYTAQEFIELDESNRNVYTSGLIDGLGASGLFGATDATVRNLSSCIKDMTSKQIAAIIAEYVQEHPEVWHVALSIEGFVALKLVAMGCKLSDKT